MSYRFLALLVGLVALLSGDAQATSSKWYRCGSTTQGQNTLTDGKCSTWAESGTSDSEMLVVETDTKITNTGTTNWTIWDADCATGTKKNVWWSTEFGATCGPLSTTDDCGSTEVVEGCYVIVPDATGANATAKAKRTGSN